MGVTPVYEAFERAEASKCTHVGHELHGRLGRVVAAAHSLKGTRLSCKASQKEAAEPLMAPGLPSGMLLFYLVKA